jgi:hypothetical protein
MSLFSRFTPIALLAILVSAPLASRAQTSYPDDNWIPQGMDALGRHASFHTDLTFDKQMLDWANGLTGDEETQRIVAKLRGISVHVYRYPEPGLYDMTSLDAVRAQYRDRGWKHLVTTQSNAASAHPGHTDLWIRFQNGNVEGMVLLFEGPTNLDLVAVNGTLSPLDLLHLRGHFGIPRFSGDGFANDNGQPVAPGAPVTP